MLDSLSVFEPLRWHFEMRPDSFSALLDADLEVKDSKILSGTAVRLSGQGEMLDRLVIAYGFDLVRAVGEGTIGRRVVKDARRPTRKEFSFDWEKQIWKEEPRSPDLEEGLFTADGRRWIQISDRMPEIDDPVWLAAEGDEQAVAGYADGERWLTDSYDDRYRRSHWTHWMPRETTPKPPARRKQ